MQETTKKRNKDYHIGCYITPKMGEAIDKKIESENSKKSSFTTLNKTEIITKLLEKWLVDEIKL